jgi:hypothetical protein
MNKSFVEELEKIAGIGETLKKVLPYLALAPVLGIGSVIGQAAAGPVLKLVNMPGKQKAYEKMLAYDQELKQYDKNKVYDVFDVVYDFSPEIGRKPILSSTLVKNTLQRELGFSHQTAKEIAETQNAMLKGRESFTKPQEGAMKALFGMMGHYNYNEEE